jgi:hypothetical protein
MLLFPPRGAFLGRAATRFDRCGDLPVSKLDEGVHRVGIWTVSVFMPPAPARRSLAIRGNGFRLRARFPDEWRAAFSIQRAVRQRGTCQTRFEKLP